MKEEYNGHERETSICPYDSVLTEDSPANFQNLIKVFRELCWTRKLKVNVSTSKVMAVSNHGGYGVKVALNGERTEHTDCTQCLGTDAHETGRMNEKIRVRERERVGEVLKAVQTKRKSVESIKVCMKQVVYQLIHVGVKLG